MTNIERHQLAENADFRLKVNVASISAAGDILAGVDRSPYLINYAQIIISNPDGQGWLNALLIKSDTSLLKPPIISLISSDIVLPLAVLRFNNTSCSCFTL